MDTVEVGSSVVDTVEVGSSVEETVLVADDGQAVPVEVVEVSAEVVDVESTE